jgi:hypothetical protein
MLEETGDVISGELEYATSLFERSTVERYGEYLRSLLRGMVQDDRYSVDRISILSAAERDSHCTGGTRPFRRPLHGPGFRR